MASKSGGFPTTRWTLILASRRGEEERRVALEQLLATYWKPLYFYVRRRGLDVDAAQDTVQDFFTHLLEKDFLDRLDPARGRFRGYLRTSIDHYLVNQHARQTALKRGGGVQFVPFDVDLAEGDLALGPEPAELAYEREWALEVMERSLRRLRLEYDEGRRRGDVETIFRFFRLGRPPSYDEAAAACGMTVQQFKASLHRARVRFREILREEVADTVDGEVECGRELSDLFRILSA